jgi:hypothetical protein
MLFMLQRPPRMSQQLPFMSLRLPFMSLRLSRRRISCFSLVQAYIQGEKNREEFYQ